jgi:hypothetical protein
MDFAGALVRPRVVYAHQTKSRCERDRSRYWIKAVPSLARAPSAAAPRARG